MTRLTRRTLLAGAAAVAAGGAALAQSAPPARTKGPVVWMGLDQKELDDSYDQSVYAPNLRQITGRYVTIDVDGFEYKVFYLENGSGQPPANSKASRPGRTSSPGSSNEWNSERSSPA